MTEFSFRVYNKRHSNYVSYCLKKTQSGWHISYIAINGDCKPDGDGLFYRNFEQDYINYPSGFGGFLKHVWSQLDTEEITNEEAQVKLQDLADWISTCEKSQPTWKEFNV